MLKTRTNFVQELKDFEVPRSTYYKWRKEYLLEGKRGHSFFTDDQWSSIDGAFWFYVEIAEMVEALRQVREMNRTHIKAGLHGNKSITQAVESIFKANPKVLELLRKTEDISIYETLGSRIFSLMQGGSLTLDQLLWLSTNLQTLIVATSIDSAAEIN